MNWHSWRWHAGRWHRVCSAADRGKALEETCRLFPEEMARRNDLFCMTRGGPPDFVPRRVRERRTSLPDESRENA